MELSALAIDEFSRNPEGKERSLVRCASDGKLNETPRPLEDFFDVDFPERDCKSSDERRIMDLLGMALDLQSPPELKEHIIAMVRANARLVPDFRFRYFYKIGSSCKSKCIENPCDFLIPRSSDPPTGIYVEHIWGRYPLQPPDFNGCYDILLFENENNETPETLLLFDPAATPDLPLSMVDSCNGVLLCEAGYFMKFYLYNLTADAYTILPRPKTVVDDPISLVDMVIAFDPNFHHYEIVALLKIPSESLISDSGSKSLISDSGSKSLISVYSTRTGVWKDSCGSSLFKLTDGHGVFCNHAVYWLSEQVVCFDLDQGRLHFIDHPFTGRKLAESKTHIRCRDFLAKSHQGTLLYVVFSSSMRALVIWELGEWSWSIRYEVDLGKACGLRPLEEIPSIDQTRYRRMLQFFDVLYFLDGAEYEDTFLVFRANGKAIRYHVASGRSYQLGYVPDVMCYSCRCLPFQHASTSAWTPRKRKPELYPTGEGMKELATMETVS